MTGEMTTKAASILDVCTEAAVDWMVLLTSGHAADNQREAFEQWLQSDARNGDAWRRVENLLDKPLHQLRQASGRMPLNAVAIQKMAAPRPRLSRRKLLRGSLALVAGASAGMLWQETRSQADYRTVTGQRQRYRLTDGSWLDLNADTAVQQNFSDSRRLIHLLHGQMVLEIADDQRPFSIKTAFADIAATGHFMLWRDGARSLVTALSDGVRVTHWQGVQQLLAKGESFWIEKQRLRQDDEHLFASTAWLDGVLEVHDAPLGDVLVLLKPWLPGYVRLSPAAARLRVFGIFQLEQPALLQVLAETLPIRIKNMGSWIAHIDVT